MQPNALVVFMILATVEDVEAGDPTHDGKPEQDRRRIELACDGDPGTQWGQAQAKPEHEV